MVGDGGVGVDDDGGHFVVTDLLQKRGGVHAVVQHPHRQRLPGDDEATDQLLQAQQAYEGREGSTLPCVKYVSVLKLREKQQAGETSR